jgi:Putative lactococcus lactis phage r1t holin
MTIWTRDFWLEAGERAIKTIAQFAVAAIGGTALNVWSADWLGILGVSLGGGVLSLLTSIATNISPLGERGSASAVRPGRHSGP